MNTGPALNCTMRYPLGRGQETVYKATVVKLGEKGDAGVVFDRSTMRLAAAWTSGYLNHSDRRFGLLNTPTPKGEMVCANPAGPGWADPEGKWDAKPPFTAPLPEKWAKYRGMYLRDNGVCFAYTVNGRDTLDAMTLVRTKKLTLLSRIIEIQAGRSEIWSTCPISANGYFGRQTENGESPTSLPSDAKRLVQLSYFAEAK